MTLNAGDFQTQLALIVAVVAVLHLLGGPLVSNLIEGIKPTGIIPTGYAGVFAIGLMALIGTVAGALAMHGDQSWRYPVVGFLAGIFGPGLGAVSSYHAQTGVRALAASRPTSTAKAAAHHAPPAAAAPPAVPSPTTGPVRAWGAPPSDTHPSTPIGASPSVETDAPIPEAPPPPFSVRVDNAGIATVGPTRPVKIKPPTASIVTTATGPSTAGPIP